MTPARLLSAYLAATFPQRCGYGFMKVALKGKQPMPLSGSEPFRIMSNVPVASVEQYQHEDVAGENDGMRVRLGLEHDTGRERNVLERLFGL